jgi:prolyl oligopeptidase
VWYVREGIDGPPRVVLDPNEMSEEGTAAVTNVVPSRDGSLLAYLVSREGSDWQQLRVRDVDDGTDLDDVIEHCKFTDVAWHPDGMGFYYNRFPDPATVEPEDRNRFNRVYFHELGTPADHDPIVHEAPDDPDLGFSPQVTEDGRYLLLVEYEGTDPKNRILFRELGSEDGFEALTERRDALYVPMGNVGSTLYVHTDLSAPRGRVVAVDLTDPGREHWREIIGQRDDVIDRATLAGGRVVATYMHDAHDLLVTTDPDGGSERSVELPGIGSVSGLSARQDSTRLLFGFMSYLMPRTIFVHDVETGQTDVFARPEISFDDSGYETVQVFCESKDGTRIPMFITRPRGVELDGDNPTLLYGYGGFNISLTPRFRAHTLLWLENGGIFAVANLRGGNEYGETWHQAGILENKQNVFDDFIAAAEWLIEEGYTRTEKLAIMGGSNGGLLTAACMMQRPELFGAVVSAVPVIDMLRYHRFSVGHFWVSDYGNAEESKEHFEFLYAYSPLHNIEPGTVHPPTLVTTADTDDRVVPMHGKKFVAALQAADAGVNPILLRVETKAGHGRGKPTGKKIEEMADIYSFLFKSLDMELSY